MILRVLYLVLGVILGVAWMALSKPSYILSQTIFARLLTTEPLASLDADALTAPAEMTAGFNKPRRAFIDERLVAAPLNWNWNYLSADPAYGDANWLYYGALEDEAEQFTLGYHWPAALGFRTGGVRHEVSDNKLFRKNGIKLKFFGKDKRIETKLGPVSTATFFYKHSGLGKVCIAYLSEPPQEAKPSDAGFMLEGYLCSKPGYMPSEEQLTCLINSVKVYDEAYWHEPEASKGRRPACSFAPGEKIKSKQKAPKSGSLGEPDRSGKQDGATGSDVS